jgi:hypothetical protein
LTKESTYEVMTSAVGKTPYMWMLRIVFPVGSAL